MQGIPLGVAGATAAGLAARGLAGPRTLRVTGRRAVTVPVTRKHLIDAGWGWQNRSRPCHIELSIT